MKPEVLYSSPTNYCILYFIISEASKLITKARQLLNSLNQGRATELYAKCKNIILIDIVAQLPTTILLNDFSTFRTHDHVPLSVDFVGEEFVVTHIGYKYTFPPEQHYILMTKLPNVTIDLMKR